MFLANLLAIKIENFVYYIIFSPIQTNAGSHCEPIELIVK